MDRTNLFAFAAARGWKDGTRLTADQRVAIASDIRGALTQAELDAAFGSPTREESVAALLEELG